MVSITITADEAEETFPQVVRYRETEGFFLMEQIVKGKRRNQIVMIPKRFINYIVIDENRG